MEEHATISYRDHREYDVVHNDVASVIVSYLCQHITQIAYEKFRWARKELNIFAKRQKLHFAIQQELVHLGYIFEIESTLLVLD